MSINGGTGKFKGATGKTNIIGEADFNTGEIALRYAGQVCFAKSDEDKDASVVSHSRPGTAAKGAVSSKPASSVSTTKTASERRRLAQL